MSSDSTHKKSLSEIVAEEGLRIVQLTDIQLFVNVASEEVSKEVSRAVDENKKKMEVDYGEGDVVSVHTGVFSSHGFIHSRASGRVFVFGMNSDFQLGMGGPSQSKETYKFPTINPFFTRFSLPVGVAPNVYGGYSLRSISCGPNSSFFTFSRNDRQSLAQAMAMGDQEQNVPKTRIYACGKNDSNKLCLNVGSEKYESPTLVAGLNSLDVSRVVCGFFTTFFITRSGRVFAAGRNSEFQLGDPSNMWTNALSIDEDIPKPVEVLFGGSTRQGGGEEEEEDLVEVRISDVAAGQWHTLFLDSLRGEVYVVGSNCFVVEYSTCDIHKKQIVHRLGLGLGLKGGKEDKDMDVSVFPTSVKIPTKLNIGVRVRSITCGENHSLFLCENNDLLGCGRNFYGELGSKCELDTPRPILRGVKEVSCGSYHTVAVCEEEDGRVRVVVCGNGEYGRLGTGKCYDADEDDFFETKWCEAEFGEENIALARESTRIGASMFNTYIKRDFFNDKDVLIHSRISCCGPNKFGQLANGLGKKHVQYKFGSVLQTVLKMIEELMVLEDKFRRRYFDERQRFLSGNLKAGFKMRREDEKTVKLLKKEKLKLYEIGSVYELIDCLYHKKGMKMKKALRFLEKFFYYEYSKPSEKKGKSPSRMSFLQAGRKKRIVFLGQYDCKTRERNGVGQEFDEKSGKLKFFGNYLMGERHGVGRLFRLHKQIPCLVYQGEFQKGHFHGSGREFDVENPERLRRRGRWIEGRFILDYMRESTKIPEIEIRNLPIKDSIGKGGSAMVNVVSYQGELVCTKVLMDANRHTEELLMNECINTACLNHCGKTTNIAGARNIIELIGWSPLRLGKLGALFEYCNLGSVFQCIKLHNESDYEGKPKPALDLKNWKNVLNILWQTVQGVVYLHDMGIVHFDLKWENVLMKLKNGKDVVIKICDFGESQFCETFMNRTGQTLKGTPCFVAPEVVLGSYKDKKKCDSFSFGMMIFSILTLAGNPFEKKLASRMNLRSILQFCEEYAKDENLRPCLEDYEKFEMEGRKSWLVRLMKRCWKSSPQLRPTFTEIRRTFIENGVLRDLDITLEFSSMSLRLKRERGLSMEDVSENMGVTSKGDKEKFRKSLQLM